MKNTNKTVQNSESAYGLLKGMTIGVLTALLALAAFVWIKDILSRLEKLPFISPQEEEKALEPLAF